MGADAVKAGGRGSARERVHARRVGRVDPLEPRDLIEGAIKAQDRVDVVVEREGDEHRVPRREPAVALEQLDGLQNVDFGEVVEAAQAGDVARERCRARLVTRLAYSLVQELLDQIWARLTCQLPGLRAAQDRAARLAMRMLVADRVHEDIRVVEEASQPVPSPAVPPYISSSI